MTAERLRVLLVEDAEDDAMLVLRELRAHGFEPDAVRVESEPEMARALRGGSWDLVLSDYSVPGFGAPQALTLLREHDPDVPFIIVSGAIDEETAAGALRAGAHDFVMKGNLARLVPAMERELREAEARREHRRANRALQERDELLRALVESSPAAILMVDADLSVRISNRAAVALLGIESHAASIEAVDLGWLEQIVARAIAGESIHEERVSGAGRGGARKHLEVSAAPVGAGRGVRGAVVIAIDVSERVGLEEQLRQSQKMEAVGRLAGGVAHDFNNILTAIRGYADFLLTDLPDTGTLRADAQEIRTAADRGSGLTRQLLTLSRKQVVAADHLDLGTVITGMEKMLRRVVGEDLVFDVRTEPRLPLFADPGQLEQVLMNLVVNARDAMPDGGTLTIRGRRTNGDLVAEGDWVVLEVSDTGTGIPSDELARIFEPFYTTKEAGRGTGLGLSIVHGIVAQSGGRILVDSEPGQGTRFRIFLPRWEAEEGPEAAEAASTDALHARESATILVAEDDDAIRAMAVRALRQAGFQVLEAENGEAAIRAADAAGGTIDLLLFDVIMPRGNGPATAREIRRKHGDAPVLFMSGYTGDAIAQHDDVDVRRNLLAKPFGQRELIERINQMLAGDRDLTLGGAA